MPHERLEGPHRRGLLSDGCRALEDVLTEAGANVVALAPSVAVALNALARHTIDIACLDINLGSETSFPLADVLALRGIPFVFVTAYNADILPPIHRHRPFVDKTEAYLELVRACWAAAASSVLRARLTHGAMPARP
jgi:CheY-like chemotaxis protein